MEAEALAKRHSLMREAVAVGAEAGAFRTILTHFSQVHAAAHCFRHVCQRSSQVLSLLHPL